MSNETLLVRNRAARGSAIRLSSTATLEYTLPTPPARWVFVTGTGSTSSVAPGSEVDSDFPFPCSAGLVGSTEAEHQTGPQCWRPW